MYILQRSLWGLLVIDKIWRNEIRNLSKELSPMHLEQLRVEGDSNEYLLNSFGYRSKEFFNTPEVIVAGCSMTFGEGVPDDGRWSDILSSRLGAQDNQINLGIRGASVGQIVLNVFSYIEKYGKPKYLFCLFPNLERIEFIFHKDLIIDRYGDYPKDYTFDYQRSYTHLNDETRIPPKYLKSPVEIQDVVPNEYATYLASGYIQMLSTYCRDAGIIFRWSTWDRKFYEECRIQQYPYFVDSIKSINLSVYEEGNIPTPECHSELLEKYGKNFHIGLDKSLHWGVHPHAHMAEEFFRSLQ